MKCKDELLADKTSIVEMLLLRLLLLFRDNVDFDLDLALAHIQFYALDAMDALRPLWPVKGCCFCSKFRCLQVS